MAYFSCMAGVGGKGNSVIVTCGADFAGIPITCTNGQKTYTKVCPSFSPYEVTFSGLVAGTWTISATVDGVVYSTTAIVTDITAVLSYGFNWQMWVDSSSSLHSEDYNDLSDLLSDEAAIRQLFTEHAPTDYAASTATVTPDLATVLNNDLCAKWINLRDYALDTLYANPLIAAAMDSADKYFYGEWGIVDDTTTPPTWGAKGNVPIMTSNTAPYGTASASNESSGYEAYKAFDNNPSTTVQAPSRVATAYLQYKFINPTNVRAFDWGAISSPAQDFSLQVSYSDDGTNFTNAGEAQTYASSVNGQVARFKIADYGYHLYWRVTRTCITDARSSIAFTLQFYGRELSVSVPTMTGNTTPFGEVSASSVYNSQFPAWKSFSPSEAYGWVPSEPNGAWCAYDFSQNVKVEMVSIASVGAGALTNVKIQGSSDNFVSDIHDLLTFNLATNATLLTKLTETGIYRKYRMIGDLNTGGQGFKLQFYGLDYSEKEFETGTTKKWLYDHGLELVDFGSPIVSGSATAEKQANQFYGKVVTGGQNSFAFAPTDAVDLTNYDLLMARAGDRFTVGNSAFTPFKIGVKAARTYSYSDATMLGEVKKGLPLTDLVLGLDISSINQSAYPMYADSTSGGERSGTIKEIWLE